MNYYITFFVTLIAVMNPIGNLPYFLTATRSFSDKKTKQVAAVAMLSIATILIGIIWGALNILNWFGISIGAFEFTGGVLIFISGIRMIYPELGTQSSKVKSTNSISLGVVPLSIPVIAGPGTIGTVIYFLSTYSSVENQLVFSFISIILALIVGLIFYFSRFIQRIIGDQPLAIIERITGLILSSMGVQICINGILHILSKI